MMILDLVWKKVQPTVGFLCKKYARLLADSLYDEKALQQEAFLILEKVIDQYNFSSASFETFYSKCLTNHFLMLYRSYQRDRKHTIVAGDGFEETSAMDEDLLGNIICDDLVEKAKQLLKPSQRQVLDTLLEYPAYFPKTRLVQEQFGMSYSQSIRAIHSIRKALFQVICSTI